MIKQTLSSKQKNIITASLILIVLLLISVGAQQPPKPIEYKLSPEASKAIIQLEAQRKAFNDEINEKENYLFLGANIPADSRQCGWDASQIVTCVPKKEAAKASPSPEKK